MPGVDHLGARSPVPASSLHEGILISSQIRNETHTLEPFPPKRERVAVHRQTFFTFCEFSGVPEVLRTAGMREWWSEADMRKEPVVPIPRVPWLVQSRGSVPSNSPRSRAWRLVALQRASVPHTPPLRSTVAFLSPSCHQRMAWR